MRVEIEHRLHSDLSGYKHLICVFESIKAQDDKQIEIDLSKLESIDGNICALLGSIFDALTVADYAIDICLPKNPDIRSQISRNRFLPSFRRSEECTETEYFMEYLRFLPVDGEKFKEHIDSQLMSKPRFPAHTKKAS